MKLETLSSSRATTNRGKFDRISFVRNASNVGRHARRCSHRNFLIFGTTRGVQAAGSVLEAPRRRINITRLHRTAQAGRNEPEFAVHEEKIARVSTTGAQVEDHGKLEKGGARGKDVQLHARTRRRHPAQAGIGRAVAQATRRPEGELQERALHQQVPSRRREVPGPRRRFRFRRLRRPRRRRARRRRVVGEVEGHRARALPGLGHVRPHRQRARRHRGDQLLRRPPAVLEHTRGLEFAADSQLQVGGGAPGASDRGREIFGLPLLGRSVRSREGPRRQHDPGFQRVTCGFASGFLPGLEMVGQQFAGDVWGGQGLWVRREDRKKRDVCEVPVRYGAVFGHRRSVHDNFGRRQEARRGVVRYQAGKTRAELSHAFLQKPLLREVLWLRHKRRDVRCHPALCRHQISPLHRGFRWRICR